MAKYRRNVNPLGLINAFDISRDMLIDQLKILLLLYFEDVII